MKISPFFIACISFALSLAAAHALAQPSGSPRGGAKPSDWEQMQQFSKEMAERQKQMHEDLAKMQKQMFENIGKSNPLLQKQDQGTKPPRTGLPAATTKSQEPAPRQYSPRAHSQALASPVAQPTMPERKPPPQSAAAVPAKPPCVYKAVMSDDEIAACR